MSMSNGVYQRLIFQNLVGEVIVGSDHEEQVDFAKFREPQMKGTFPLKPTRY